VLEDLPDAVAILCRALDVLDGTNSLLDFLTLEIVLASWLRLEIFGNKKMQTYLLHCNRLLRGLVQLFNSLWVESQILLAADEDDWEPRAEMQHFGDPL
jgi:hypothetical protein